MSDDDLMEEVRRGQPDLANDRDALIAEAERQMREVEEAIVRLDKAIDDMRSRDQSRRAISGGVRCATLHRQHLKCRRRRYPAEDECSQLA